MFIPLSEVDTEYREGGEERNNFYFYQRDRTIPVEVKITRLPPFFNAELNWHRHKYVEEFSVFGGMGKACKTIGSNYAGSSGISFPLELDLLAVWLDGLEFSIQYQLRLI